MQHVREVRLRTVQQRKARLFLRHGKAALHQNGADALEPDGKAHRRDALTQKFADHFVVAPAARDRARERGARHLEHHARVIALPAHERGRVLDGVTPARQPPHRIDHAAQRVAQAFVRAQRGHVVQRERALLQKFRQRPHGPLRHGFLRQLVRDALRPDLIQLVEADTDGIQRFHREAEGAQHPAQKAAVIDVYREIVKSNGQQRARRNVEQFDFGVGALVAKNINITLHEFAQTALLRALGAIDAVGLDHLERRRQRLAVGRVIA